MPEFSVWADDKAETPFTQRNFRGNISQQAILSERTHGVPISDKPESPLALEKAPQAHLKPLNCRWS